MTAHGLCEATSINIGDIRRDTEAIPDQSEVLRSCSSLIRMSVDGKRFEFAHFTVAEFLKSIDDSSGGEFAAYKINSDNVLTGLAKVCLTYLNFQDFDQYGPSSKEITKDRFERYPFRRYAIEFWVYHADVADWDDQQLFSFATEFYHPSKRGTFITWMQDRIWCERHRDYQRDELFLAEATTLHIATMDGLFEVCQWLVENGCDVNRSTTLGTPLYCALSSRHVTATHHERTTFCGTGRRTAGFFFEGKDGRYIRGGRERVLQILLEAGADPNIAFRPFSPLYLAFEGGPQGSVPQLLQKGAIVDDLLVNQVLDELELDEQDEQIHHSKEADAQYIIESAPKYDISEETRARALRYSLKAQATNISALLPASNDSTGGIQSYKRANEASLRTAGKYGQVEAIMRLLDDHHVDVNAAEESTFKTALHYASERDHLEVVRLLVARGADPCRADSSGRSALHHSVKMGTRCLDFYLQQNCDTTITDEEHLTVWHLAALNKNIGALRTLLNGLNSKSLPIPLTRSRGLSLISCASQSGSTEAVSLLLDAGCSTSDLDSEGWTPLHQTAGSGSPEMTRFLIARGADAQAITDNGSSVTYCAMMLDGPKLDETLDILLSTDTDPFKARQDGITPMEVLISHTGYGSEEGRVNALRRLLSVPRSSEEKQISLSHALSSCFQVRPSEFSTWHSSAFEVLLENGADLINNITGGKSAFKAVLDIWQDQCLVGGTWAMTWESGPLAVATKMLLSALEHIPSEIPLQDLCSVPSLLRSALTIRNDHLVFKLLDYSPDVDLSIDDSDDSPIRYACRNGCSHLVLEKLLPRSKALSESAFGSDLVREACQNLSKDSNAILLELLRSGLDCKGHSPKGETALMYAAGAGNVDMVDTLLAHGSDAKARDHNGQTAGHYACNSGTTGHHARNSGHLEVLRILRHYTDWNATASCVMRGERFDNVTVLHLAAANERDHILSFLLDEDLIKDIDGVTDRRETALAIAAWVGKPRNVSLLLSKKADPTLMSTWGSPLHIAARFGFAEVMSIFMSHGCNLKLPDRDGLDCEMLAWQHGHELLATMIEEHVRGRTASKSSLFLSQMKSLNSDA